MNIIKLLNFLFHVAEYESFQRDFQHVLGHEAVIDGGVKISADVLRAALHDR
ncbi:MAG: hypothetical protein IT544_04335 [Rhodobacteraceae bacterium]|nr:hypothetical protein [Paracoccaceae bacterium]